MLGHGGFHVVVHRARLHDAELVFRIDFHDAAHRGQVEHDAPGDGIGPAGQAGARPAGYHRDAKLRAGAHDLLDLMLGPHPDGGGSLARRRPLGVVVGEGAQHVLVGDQAAGRQPAAQRLDHHLRHGGCHASAPVISAAATAAPPMVMIELAWSVSGAGRTVTSEPSSALTAATAAGG